MTPLRFLLVCFAGWMNQRQQLVIEYLQEEIRVLQEQLGKQPRFNDDQRRRLAAKGKAPICQHRYSRYASGLAPSSDCQEIRFEQEAQTGSPAYQSGHSRTG